MRRSIHHLFLPLVLLFLGAVCAGAAELLSGPGSLPIEITATGRTTYINGIATAHDNVAIHFGDTDIYSDYARYDSAKHSIYLRGRVRIYRGVSLYLSDEATYNIDSKAIDAHQMRGGQYPYLFAGQTVTSANDQEYLVSHGVMTTDDSSNPDFHLSAQNMRIYQNDRVIMRNVTLYLGDIPIFWFPYLYQSLDQSFSYSIAPAYLSSWGPSLLGQVTFPLTDDISSTVRLDYRTRRGVALGFDSVIKYGRDKKSEARLSTYFIEDQNPNVNQTAVPRTGTPTSRYRLTLQDRTVLADGLELTTDLTKLSDPYILQDYYPSEFIYNPQPDNNIALTKTSPFYTLTAYGRFALNNFFDTTERLPEVALDIKRHGIFGSPIFYEGDTSAGYYVRNFASGSLFTDYSAFRVDSFHQLSYPNTYFGFLSIIPRIGFRETYYSRTENLNGSTFVGNVDPLAPLFPLPDPSGNPFLGPPLHYGPGAFRSIFNAGIEGSFKISRVWDDVQNRSLGLDGLRHVIQPFFDYSYLSSPNVDPNEILQFDRVQPSTKLNPIDFPDYTSIDSLDRWSIARVGVRNRIETRRDDLTVSWLELETYVDVNFNSPFDKNRYSNLFNNLTFTPLPWATLTVDSQVPLYKNSFTEVDTAINFKPTAETQITIGHRYLNNNPFFLNSSLFTIGGYYRINDNWGAGFSEQYEAATHLLEEQRYSVYRDLSSWVASFGAIVRNNNGVKEYGVLLTFTLKAFPKFGLNLNFDPAGTGQSSQATP